MRQYGDIKRKCADASSCPPLKFYEFSFIAQGPADKQSQQQMKLSAELQRRRLFQVYPQSAPRVRRQDGKSGGYVGAPLTSDITINEVFHHLMQLKTGHQDEQNKLEPRPANLVDDGPLLFLEMQPTSRKKLQKSERKKDRWKNAGGKRSNTIISVPDVVDTQLLRRRGKVIREGLPSVKYDQFSLVDMEGKSVNTSSLFQLRGLVDKAGSASKSPQRNGNVTNLKRTRAYQMRSVPTRRPWRCCCCADRHDAYDDGLLSDMTRIMQLRGG